MPPHPPPLNHSKMHSIRTYLCNPHHSPTPSISTNTTQLPKTVPMSKRPPQDPLPLLEKAKSMAHLKQIHAHMMSTGLIHNPIAASKLVAYLSSHPSLGNVHMARLIADGIDGLDAYTWNTIIRGYLDRNNPTEAILVFAHMIRKGLEVDSYSLLFVIKACGLILRAAEGRQVHAHIFKKGFESEIITQTALVKMYGLSDDLADAQRIFDETPQRDSVIWNALIAIYAQMGHPHLALSLSCAMIYENVRPDEVTASGILSACTSLKALKRGKMVHGFVIKCIIAPDALVHNALIDMYAKCGCLANAHWIFERMPGRNLVSWTSMLNAYSDNDHLYGALMLFREMESANVRPDEPALLGLVNMCSKFGSFELGKWADHYIRRHEFGESTCISNALMDMHAKCGNIDEACRIFNTLVVKTLVSWTTIIQGLAMHGHGIAALVRFSQMQREGFSPDSIVFLSILSACNHAGLVDEGQQCFMSMVEEHGLAPWMEHYGCMIDLLCRAGLVNEAVTFVERMPVKPDVVMWRTLVGACKNQGNMTLARQLMGHLLELELKDSGNYILMSNLYATIGHWDGVKKVRNEMGVRRVSKSDAGCSLIEVNNDICFH